VLLLDEITVDLDVLARADLLKFLRKECEQRGSTIIYATHIFDGLDDWPTHIVCTYLLLHLSSSFLLLYTNAGINYKRLYGIFFVKANLSLLCLRCMWLMESCS